MISAVLIVISCLATTGLFLTGESDVENIALHAKAKALNERDDAGRAVDGNSETHFFRGFSCTHTHDVKDPWWMVDLGSLSEVHRVDITNRGDCCWERLSNFTLQMSQELEDDQETLRDKSLCAHYHPGSVGRGATVEFACTGPVYARHVKVQVYAPRQYLTLCEVKVWGIKPAPTPSACPSYVYTRGRKSPGLVLKEITLSVGTLCAVRCHKTEHCYSFNVRENHNSVTCELLEDVRELRATDIMAEAGWLYFRSRL